jgi:hypothetical protein
LPYMRVKPLRQTTSSACGQRCGMSTDRIADALQPAVLLIQQLMPPCRALCVEDPGRHVDPCPRGVAVHIAGHDSDLWIMPYPFHLAGVCERSV